MADIPYPRRGPAGPPGKDGAAGGAGTVTNVTGTTPIAVATGTTTPVVSLNDTAVTPGAYTNLNATIDQKGRITAAANGSGGAGTVTSVSGTAPIAVATGTTTPVVSLNDTAVTPGVYTNLNATIDQKGRITAAANGSGGSSLPSIFASFVDLCVAIPANVSSPGGSFTTGARVAFTAASTITGVRLYWKSVGGARTMKCQAWDPSGTSQGSITVAVNATNVYTVSFGSPIAVSGTNLYKQWIISAWDNSGGNYTSVTVSSSGMFKANSSSAPLLMGPYYIMGDSAIYVGGDAKPTTATTSEIYPVEPIFTTP